MNKYSTILIIIVSIFIIGAQKSPLIPTKEFKAQEKWVDSVYTNMTQKERFAQLLTIPVYSNKGLADDNRVKLQIMKQKVGAVLFMGGNPTHQVELTNQFQKISKVPLLVAMDAERDFGKLLDSAHTNPYNLLLGAVEDDKLIEQMGKRIGAHSKRLGVHVVFASVPVVQTENNLATIGNRSYGEDIAQVAKKITAFTRGIQSTGTIAGVKYFPSVSNSTLTIEGELPELTLSVEQLDSIQFVPYKALIKNKLGAVQTAHIQVPNLTSVTGLSASLSHNIVTKKLKNELGFKGLTFSAPLNDPLLREGKESGEVELAAFVAGNDLLLLPEDVPAVIAKFEEALQLGIIKETRVARAVKNILRTKYKLGLATIEPLSEMAVVDAVDNIKDDLLYHEAVKQAITAVKVDKSIIPIRDLVQQKIAYIKMGDADESVYVNTLRKYAAVDVIKEENLASLIEKLLGYSTVIIGLHKSDASPTGDFNFTRKEIDWLQQLARTNKIILNVFASPHSLKKIKSFTNIENIIVSYDNSPLSQEVSAQIIFGAQKAQGKLPVAIGEEFPLGTGFETSTLGRLGYDLPETVGVNSKKLKRIDSLAELVVSEKMAPGVQLLIARKGKIIYNKNFGYHTYQKKKKVTDHDMYDVASMTKILATLPLIMQLEENKQLSLSTRLGSLLPKFKGTNKEKLKIVEILSHYARLKPWIPFYVNTLDTLTKKPNKKWYSDKKTKQFNVKVANKLYMNAEYKDSIMQRIMDSDLLKRKRYRYSDLPFYILKDYVEATYEANLNTLTQQYFYKSLGAHRTTYNPLEKFSKKMIVPSEKDDYYRNQVLQGYVHDMGAAMQGGIGGHAGLFSTATDVAKMMQMYMQGGSYGGVQYLESATIDKFNNCYYCHKDNRRGVGFDKPQLGDVGPTCGCVSMKSFGHSGFTGTYTWADPDEEIVYVFLSNRTYPTMTNKKLIKTDIRTKIQKLIYEAIEE
ncbi:glycoside hydrolase family 3 N-terminal domain-containing protein [Kordia sp.]|uniref:glycoside hydrolase family 3 N-terminal domain-containing protein n=1 Tax=Kordia sp. TaxID=1965332 RepID=UPI0025B82FFE|nr:glycoside hydrolase family 3 N-terminal domain-containing protein [Kordia sp.]MCH2197029.1 serine hydrolase [Kordia sp.]